MKRFEQQKHSPGSVEVDHDRLVTVDQRLELLLGLEGLQVGAKVLLLSLAFLSAAEVLQAAFRAGLDALAARLPVCWAHLQI